VTTKIDETGMSTVSFLVHSVQDSTLKIYDHGWFATFKLSLLTKNNGWVELEIFCDSIEDIQNLLDTITSQTVAKAERVGADGTKVED
jgi:hypothetical protein